MCYNFGWEMNSDKPTIYIHLSGSDVKKTLLASYSKGENKRIEPKLVPINCMRCNDILHPNSQFCYKCGLKTDKKELYADIDRDRKIKELDIKFENLSFMLQRSLENFMKFHLETTAEFLEHAMKCFHGKLDFKLTKRKVTEEELIKHFIRTEKQKLYSIEDLKLLKSIIKPIIIPEIDVMNNKDENCTYNKIEN